ncbi:MAG: GNAT family acetyltransferase [Deltaproteobacteria bacterium]|nr:GNAT family acetyltransferase [Deltaproteobacteria bacterium]
MLTIDSLVKSVKERGIKTTFGDLAYRAAKKVTDVRVLAAMSLMPEHIDRSFLTAEPDLQWGFLDGETLQRALSHVSDSDMDQTFVRSAIGGGDRCYGALDGDILASYGWYATKPTEVTEGLELRFSDQWAYMYKGYTPKAYRGRRLHGIGMARAMMAFVDEGYKGLVSYVDAANEASLKSCARLGYQTFGTLMAAQVRSSWLTHATRGCEPYQIQLAATRSAPTTMANAA